MSSPSISKAIALCIFLTVGPNFVYSFSMSMKFFVANYELGEKPTQLFKLIEQKNVLNYGDKCNPGSEKIRTQIQSNFRKEFLMDPQESRKNLVDFQKLVEIKDDFCNEFDFLECNADTATCDCWYRTLPKNEFGFQIKTKWDGVKCAGIRGTVCAPKENQQEKHVQLIGIPNQAGITCREGTLCLGTLTKIHCNEENSLEIQKQEALNVHPNNTNSKKTSNQFCSCDILPNKDKEL